MFEYYKNDSKFRKLHEDDIVGIQAIYGKVAEQNGYRRRAADVRYS